MTVIFVHGTGTREPALNQTVERVKQELGRHLPDQNVLSCSWGEVAGYKLHGNGISIPGYAVTPRRSVLGVRDMAPEGPFSLEEYEVALWGLLYRDSLAELRLLAAEAASPSAVGRLPSVSTALDIRLRTLGEVPPPPEMQSRLELADIAPQFVSAIVATRSHVVYHDALKAVKQEHMEDLPAILARAVVARATTLRQQEGDYPQILLDADLRDVVVDHVLKQLAGPSGTLGILDPVKDKARQIVAQIITDQLGERRGPVMDTILGFIGDILVYQGAGARIRGLIQTSIEQAESPVTLLAHSLGGIACVDLLLDQNLSERVKLLVTVGSQSPIFYEIGALQKLPYAPNAALPQHFPRWLNIYDAQDFLSFVGEGLFPGRVTDVLVNNRQPFPYAHSAYWANEAVWSAIANAIRTQ